jgi:hypothetical protein
LSNSRLSAESDDLSADYHEQFGKNFETHSNKLNLFAFVIEFLPCGWPGLLQSHAFELRTARPNTLLPWHAGNPLSRNQSAKNPPEP